MIVQYFTGIAGLASILKICFAQFILPILRKKSRRNDRVTNYSTPYQENLFCLLMKFSAALLALLAGGLFFVKSRNNIQPM